MATTYTTTEASNRSTAKGAGLSGQLKVASAVYQMHASPTTNDIIQAVKVPAGAVINPGDVVLGTEDLDSGGTPTLKLSVGYGGDDDYFIKSETTVGQAPGVKVADANPSAIPLTFTQEDTIDVKIVAKPQTATTNKLTVSVKYDYNPNYDNS